MSNNNENEKTKTKRQQITDHIVAYHHQTARRPSVLLSASWQPHTRKKENELLTDIKMARRKTANPLLTPMSNGIHCVSSTIESKRNDHKTNYYYCVGGYFSDRQATISVNGPTNVSTHLVFLCSVVLLSLLSCSAPLSSNALLQQNQVPPESSAYQLLSSALDGAQSSGKSIIHSTECLSSDPTI